MVSKYFYLSLLASLPLAGLAQSSPQLYVGASAALVRFSPFESGGTSYVGPAATVGLQLSPRWAFETGAQLAWHSETYTYRPIYSSSTLDYVTVDVHSTALIVPLLARYTFTGPTSRLRVDALGGVSWLHSSGRVDYTSGPAGSVYQSGYSNGSSNDAAVVLGPQLRYSLGSALEAKLNLPLQFNVMDGNGNFSDRLFLTPQLGVQYAFGH